MSSTDTRPAIEHAMPNVKPPAGFSDALSGHGADGTHEGTAAEGMTSPQARPSPVPTHAAPAGSSTSHGQTSNDAHPTVAVAPSSPQATSEANPSTNPPAGTNTSHGQPSRDAQAVPAVAASSPQASMGTITNPHSPAGSTNGHGHPISGTQDQAAVTASIPGQAGRDTHHMAAGDLAGQPAAKWVTVPNSNSPLADPLGFGGQGDDQGQPAANGPAMPISDPPLADPLLALAADVLDDLEKIRIANENRYRQLTRTGTDADGEERGFGLDESHPDVARLAALVVMVTAAEHQAELNLARLMRKHPLGPWVKATAGIGEKQGARLLAAIGDPYVRPEITRADGSVEPSRPRLVSELWAYAGYHVIKTPVSGQPFTGTQDRCAAGGSASGQGGSDTQKHSAGNGSHPGHVATDDHFPCAGVAARRQRGTHANWSAAAKMRAYLVAVSCMKHLNSPYRAVYDAARARYAAAVHEVPCPRCGPAGKPALTGSPLSDGHKHARALRAVAKEILRDLWREACRIHGVPAPRGGSS